VGRCVHAVEPGCRIVQIRMAVRMKEYGSMGWHAVVHVEVPSQTKDTQLFPAKL